ncbi:MAG: Sodium/glucose cotransporter [Candidatus Hydrogenedentes bacterium ADurb.Bin101]|jgi:Na+/proline symporter|nr:MAG: Sodium/glucose cotransporter [Candidatus Hydrogenedentes bacterium ADurb.Bin101]HOH28055.1 sodium:solute symporter family protein [Candidatus Hydrogenedentota bacterium]
MLGLSGWDWAALAVYFGIVVGIGVWSARRVSNTSDFFIGGRRFGKVMMVFFAFGAGTSGNDAVGVSSKTYTGGMSGIWFQWLWLFCTPFYWLIAPVFRRMRALTTGDYFEQRYDGSVAVLYTVVGIGLLIVNIGVLQLGAASMIEALTGGAVNRYAAVLVMTVLFVFYGIAGGLAAAIITDFLQGMLTLVLSFLLIPFALDAVGGFAGLHAGIRDAHMFSLVAPGEINLFYIVMLCASAIIGIVTQPHTMGTCAAGRTELDGQIGFAGGNLLKRFCTVAWMLVGLCGVVMFAGESPAMEPDLVYGAVAQRLLPAIMPGLVGIFLAALVASLQSSCDAFMVSCSALFTQNLYRRWLVCDKPDGHYVLVGRLTAVAVAAAAVTFSFLVRDVPSGLVWFFKLQALMGAAFWLGLFWRRATVAGAWAATLVGFAILFFTSLPQFHAWAVEHLPATMIWEERFRDSWQIAAYLSGAFLSGILVSLVTPRVDNAKLDQLYACLRTPIQPGETHQARPFTLPPGVDTPPARKLIRHPDFEIAVPSARSLYGFLFLWAWVGLLIVFVYWLSGVGAA